MNKSAKKGINIGSYHTVCVQRHLKNKYDEEVLDSVTCSLQAAELKDTKHDLEVTEKDRKFPP